MENKTATPKKVYTAPTVTRHGDAVEQTMGHKYGTGELRNPGGPPHID